MLIRVEDCCTGSITQNHPWKTYVMSFGLYFEVCTKKVRISKKILDMVLFSAENGENGCFSDKISDISENTSYISILLL